MTSTKHLGSYSREENCAQKQAVPVAKDRKTQIEHVLGSAQKRGENGVVLIENLFKIAFGMIQYLFQKFGDQLVRRGCGEKLEMYSILTNSSYNVRCRL